MNGNPLDQLMGGVKARKMGRTAAAIGSSRAEADSATRDRLGSVRQAAYKQAMMDFMYATAVLQQEQGQGQDMQLDPTANLPGMD